MNRLKKVFGIGALVLTFLTTGGCKGGVLGGRPPPIIPSYVEGTVTKEGGTLAQVVKSNISDPTYVLQIQTPEGLYTASIYESLTQPLEALAFAIEEGSKIRVKKEYWDPHFRNDTVGYLFSEYIIVDGKE